MKIDLKRGLWRAVRGTAAIEFAVLAPALLTVAYGVYEFGRMAWTLEALQESATQGARCAGIKQTSCETGGAFSSSATATYIQGVATGWGLTIPSADITATGSTTCAGVSGFAQVQISYVFNTTVANLLPSLANGATLTVKSCYPVNSS
ncbi:MAG TPA: TadE/TadG family type IV pilus assembly protein [Rhizomicrobium sp.]|jgi:Flp pilus assembly protein TadG